MASVPRCDANYTGTLAMCRHTHECPNAAPMCGNVTMCPDTGEFVGSVEGPFLFNEYQTSEPYNAMNEERYGNPGTYPWGERQRQVNVAP